MHPVYTIHTGFHTSQSLPSRKQSNLNHPITTGDRTLQRIYLNSIENSRQPVCNATKKVFATVQEAKKLPKELHKEEIASQWARLLPGKLMQESFLEQLDALQALDQLAPLTAAKEHLPGDIIDILAHFGKVDNNPFNQLYSLAEDCADRYYTKVIQTLTHLMKDSFHDRQLILVNTARALKFLKSYAS